MATRLSVMFCSLLYVITCATSGTCDSNDESCSAPLQLIPVGECTVGSQSGGCLGTLSCKEISNSALRLCIDTRNHKINKLNRTQIITKILRNGQYNGAESFCLTDPITNTIYDFLCKRINGKCDRATKKCIFQADKRQKTVLALADDIIRSRFDKTDENNQNLTNNLLIAVDGIMNRNTFQLNWYNKSLDQLPSNTSGNFKSHITNFYYSYKGQAYYYRGPNALYIDVTKADIKWFVKRIKANICNFITTYLSDHNYDNKDFSGEEISSMINLDFVGYDRGGYVIIEVGNKLLWNGCQINGKNVRPIYGRFMGLYNPSQSMINSLPDWMDGPFDTTYFHRVPLNAKNVFIAYSNPEIYKIPMFNVIDINMNGNSDVTDEYIREKKYFQASHDAVGCAPDGCSELYWVALGMNAFNDKIGIDYKSEVEGSKNSDMYIRQKASECGVIVDATTEDYYQY